MPELFAGAHEAIAEDQRDLMNRIAAGLDLAFNGECKPAERKVGFVLLSFNFGQMDGGRVNYISNAKRDDVLAALKEFLARAEGRYQPGGQG